MLAGLAVACAPYQFRGAVYDPPIPAPDFSLADAHGQAFRLSAHRGEVVLLTFGYTNCPDVCPATLALTRQAVGDLTGDGGVSVAFVTVDPLRDTPQVLGQYLANFNPDFVGLTGDPLALAQVLENYGIAVDTGASTIPGMAYDTDHSARVYLIDPSGQLRAQYPAGFTADELRQDVQHVLAGA